MDILEYVTLDSFWEIHPNPSDDFSFFLLGRDYSSNLEGCKKVEIKISRKNISILEIFIDKLIEIEHKDASFLGRKLNDLIRDLSK